MNFFIDTNIIIDLLLKREVHYENSLKIFNHSAKQEIKLFTSSHAFVTTYYVCKKAMDESLLRSLLEDLLAFISVISVDESMIKRALTLVDIKDYEDAVQICSTQSIKAIDGIITRNQKDFKNSDIKAFTPDEALVMIKNKLNDLNP